MAGRHLRLSAAGERGGRYAGDAHRYSHHRRRDPRAGGRTQDVRTRQGQRPAHGAGRAGAAEPLHVERGQHRAPGETVEVTIEYQQTLRYDTGSFSLRFPLAITPRYIPGTPVAANALAERHRESAAPLRFAGLGPAGWAVDTDAVPDASRITPPVPHPSSLPEGLLNPVSLEIELDAGMPLAAVESRSHDLRVERRGEGRYRLVLAAERVASDRDFELVWRPQAGNAPRAALFQEQRDGKTYALVMVMPPGGPRRCAAAARGDLHRRYVRIHGRRVDRTGA